MESNKTMPKRNENVVGPVKTDKSISIYNCFWRYMHIQQKWQQIMGWQIQNFVNQKKSKSFKTWWYWLGIWKCVIFNVSCSISFIVNLGGLV